MSEHPTTLARVVFVRTTVSENVPLADRIYRMRLPVPGIARESLSATIAPSYGMS